MDLSGVSRPVVVPVRPDPTGRDGPTPEAVRWGRWRRSSRGLYVPAGAERTTDQRVVEAAAALPGDWGGVTGWAALAWCGAVWFDGSPWGGGLAAPVTLAIGGNRWMRPQSTFATSEERLAPTDLVTVDGMRITTAVWEHEAGHGRTLCNQPVFGPDGQLLGVPDLIDPDTGVVGEYDGRLHLEGRQRSRDVDREAVLRRHGLEPVTMLAGDRLDPSAFVRRLHSAYDRAADRPATQRTWTLEQPGWWIDTTTVAARRALDPYWRHRLLRHRSAA